MVRKGEAWERPATGPAETTVEGGDADIAAAVAGGATRLAFAPAGDSDLARALGLGWGPEGRELGSLELPLDAMRVTIGSGADDGGEDAGDITEHLGVNLVVLATPPDQLGLLSPRVVSRITIDGRPAYDGKAASVVVANGQYLRGADVVPRGHPGDGRLEVQAYAPTVGEARAVRDRLATGTHLPHPRIAQATGRRVEIELNREVRVEIDGVERERGTRIVVEVVPEAFSLVM